MRVLAILFTLLMFSGTALAADEPTDSLNAEVVRFLHAWGFGKEVKDFFAKAVSRGALDEQTGRAIAQLSDHRYAELAAPVFRSFISKEEARELADLYSTEEMQVMLEEQRRSGSAAPVARTPKQAAVVEQYMRSSAPQTTARLRDAMSDPTTADQFNAALAQELQQSADSK